MFEVPVSIRPADRLRTMAGPEAGERYDAVVRDAWVHLRGRRVWHVNATAEGGGVAELLRTTLGYLAGDGIEVRWLVIEGDARFFEITKRIHNRLHGDLGDGGPLGEAERRHYDETLRRELAEILRIVRPDDLVVVHDPQPLGLVPASPTRASPSCGRAMSEPTRRRTSRVLHGRSCARTYGRPTPPRSPGARTPGKVSMRTRSA